MSLVGPRIRAAELDTSVSRLVGQMLKEKMRQEQQYEAAMNEYLYESPTHLKKPGDSYPRREELY